MDLYIRNGIAAVVLYVGINFGAHDAFAQGRENKLPNDPKPVPENTTTFAVIPKRLEDELLAAVPESGRSRDDYARRLRTSRRETTPFGNYNGLGMR